MKTIKLQKGTLNFKDDEIEGFILKKITKFGNGAKVDVPKKFRGKRAYVVIPNGRKKH